MAGLHLTGGHPLATVAARHCVDHSSPLIGGVACGNCWERAIRDDEWFAAENDLPRDLRPDPQLVDEVAVERAMRGHPVALTRTERQVAIARLFAKGRRPVEIAAVLRTNRSTITRELERQETATAGAA
jgi:hypothetical protein